MLRKHGTTVAIVFAAAIAVAQLRAAWGAHTLLGDYRAFWCAAHVFVHGGNPYKTAPLLLCERAAAPWHLYTALPSVAVPSPLPPYAIAGFVPLGALPYAFSCIAFTAILLICTIACAAFATRAFSIPAVAATCAFALPAAYLWLPYGEIVPIALAAALFAICMLRQGNTWLAAAALAVTALEPHVAIGAWLAVFAYRRNMRLPLTVAGGVLALLWLAVTPNMQYLLQVIPLHALAELPRTSQLSSAWMLHALGAPDGVALQAAGLIAAAGIAASVLVVPVLYRRLRNDAVLVAFPLGVTAATAAFLHEAQTAFLLPWAFVLWNAGYGRLRALSIAAIVLSAVPWLRLLADPLVTLAAAVAAAALASVALRSRIAALRGAVATAVLCTVILLVHGHDRTIGPAPREFPAGADRTFASASWGRYVWKNESRATIGVWLAKAPLWAAIVLLISGTLAVVRTNENIVARVGIEHVPVRP